MMKVTITKKVETIDDMPKEAEYSIVMRGFHYKDSHDSLWGIKMEGLKMLRDELTRVIDRDAKDQ